MLISVSLNSSFEDRLCEDTTRTYRITQVFQKVTIQARTAVIAAVNSHHVLVMAATTLLDHDEFFANMWLPNGSVHIYMVHVAMNSCFIN